MSGGGSIHRLGAGIAAVVIVGFLLAGCGGSSPSQAPGSTLLGRTLAKIRDDPSVRNFEFGDITAQRSLAGVPPKLGAGHPASRWQRVLGFGADYFLEDPGGKRDGLDIMTGAVAVGIGEPPHRGALITGPLVDGANVRTAIQRLGATRGTVAGQPGLVWGKQGELHTSAADRFGIGPALGEFDRAVITSHTVIAARYESEVATLIGPGSHPATDDPVLAATSSCLGDVIAAQAVNASLTGSSAGAVTEIAAGVRRPAGPGSSAQEVLCVVRGAGASGPTAASLCSRIGPQGPALPGASEAPGAFDVSARPSSGESGGQHWTACTVTDRPSAQAGWLPTLLVRTDALAALTASS